MAIHLNDNIYVDANKAADPKYGPWTSVDEAKTNVPEVYRHLGLTVGIINGTSIVEYWWRDGITDDSLVAREEVVAIPLTTATEAYNLAVAGTLIPGQRYSIPFKTKHLINYSTDIWEAATSETLILTAVSNTTFDKDVKSVQFPQDSILFDITNRLCEDGTTAREGKITYRKDTLIQIEAYYDWRNVKFRRWKLTPAAWVSTTTYARGAAVLGSDGAIYASKKNSNIGNDPTTIPYYGNSGAAEYAVTISPLWEKMFIATKSQYLGVKPTSVTLGSSTIPVNAADYTDYYTFNTTTVGALGTMRAISIGSATTYNNIIFIANHTGDNGNTVNNIQFDVQCTDFTITGRRFNNNKIGSNSTGGIFQGGFEKNILGANFSYNVWTYNNCSYWDPGISNTIGSDFTKNVVLPEFNNNNISGNTAINYFSITMTNNFIRTQCFSCSMGLEYRDNVSQKLNGANFGYRCQLNTFLGSQFIGGIVNTTIGDDCMGNTVLSMNNNTIGNFFKYNVIQAPTFDSLTIPNNFENNKIFGVVTSSYFAAGTNRNVINHNFSASGTVGAPLLLKSSTFNAPVSGLNIDQVGTLTLENTVVNVPITSKTISPQLGAVLSKTSPDGSIWKDGIDNDGVLNPIKVSI